MGPRDHLARPDDHGGQASARDRRVEHLAPQEERARRPGGRRSPRPAARSPARGAPSTHRRGAAGRRPRAAAGTRRPRRRGAARPSVVVARRATSSSSRSSVPFISPSSCRLRPVIISLSPIRSRPPRTGCPSGFSAARSAWLMRVDPELAAVDGREHLDVADRVDAVVARAGARRPARRSPPAPSRGRARSIRNRSRRMPVARRELGHLAAADRVRALDDHAVGGLAEDVGQPRRRHQLGGDQLGERLAGADGRELVGVADEHHVGLGRRRRAAASPAARGWPSRSRRRSAGRSAAGPARRGSGPRPGIQPSAECTVRARTPLVSVIRTAARPVGATSITRAPRALGRGGDRLDRRRLAGARAAGDHRQPVGEGRPQRRPAARR